MLSILGLLFLVALTAGCADDSQGSIVDPSPHRGEIAVHFRRNVVELLQLLADRGAQIQYERDVPIADVPAELVCMWFDDLYHPKDETFRSAFTPSELDVLAEFHRKYAASLKAIGTLPHLPNLTELHAHPAWERVVSGAQEALDSVAGEDHCE